MVPKRFPEQGLSNAKPARRLRVGRRTIHLWIGTGQLDHHPESDDVGYSPRPKAPHKLDPFKETINTRLDTYPKLTAQRLFEEVRPSGHEGGYSR